MAVDHAEPKARSHKKPVERPVGVNPVIRIDVPDMVVVITQRGIENTHSSKTVDTTVPVGDMNAPNPVHPSVKVVEYRNVLYLNHGSVIIVLYEGVVIIA
jgi:hypothetical protein